ncbi:hypothetical protein Tco_1147204 [Tanacetum coccineum]
MKNPPVKETEDKIKEGTLQVDQGTDTMTLVLGKEKGGYARGVGSGVTYKRYFDLPRSKQEGQLQSEGMVTELKNQLATQEGQLQERTIYSRVSTGEKIHPINCCYMDGGGRNNVVGCDRMRWSILEGTVKSVELSIWTRSIRKDSSVKDALSKDNVSVLPQIPYTRGDGKIMLHNKQSKGLLSKCKLINLLVDAAFFTGYRTVTVATTVLDE